jgi:hypothetical protein
MITYYIYVTQGRWQISIIWYFYIKILKTNFFVLCTGRRVFPEGYEPTIFENFTRTMTINGKVSALPFIRQRIGSKIYIKENRWKLYNVCRYLCMCLSECYRVFTYNIWLILRETNYGPKTYFLKRCDMLTCFRNDCSIKRSQLRVFYSLQ